MQLNVFFDVLSNFCLKRFLFLEELCEMLLTYVDVHVKYPLCLSDFKES